MRKQETDFRNHIQNDADIPEVVQEKAGCAFQEIKQQGKQKVNSKSGIRKTVIALGGMAAACGMILALGLTNPAFASQLPWVGHIFERFQDNYSYPGDFSSVAQPLETETETKRDAIISNQVSENASKYTKTVNGVTMTLSELYCNDQALYLSLELKKEDGFPVEDIMVQYETKQPIIAMNSTETYDFTEEKGGGLYYLEGKFIDDKTYAGIVRVDYKLASEQAVAKEGGDLQKAETLDEFNLKLDINKIIANKANPDIWDSGYTGEELEAMSDEEWRAVMKEQPVEWSYFPNRYENIWWEGDFSFDLDVKVDRSRTNIFEIGTANEDGFGIKSVEITPFELKVNETVTSADIFPVVLDAGGKMLDYGNSGYVTDYAIYGRDISTLNIYLCDYVEYMDEIKGFKMKPDFKAILDERAVYHTTLDTGIFQKSAQE